MNTVQAATTILVIGDGAVGTGFARILHGILHNLPSEQYSIHHLAVNYKGDPHELPWKVYTACSAGDSYGVNRIRELVDKLHPQLIFCLNDLWVLNDYVKILKECRDKAKVVFYYSLDAGPVDPEWVKDSGFVERRVAFTQYAKKELQKALGEGAAIEVIPPGIDFKTFFPFPDCHEEGRSLDGTTAAKRKLGMFKDDQLEGSFIVLNANRNQPRKRIDISIKGFSLFARSKPDNVKLYLHTGFEDFGWNIFKLCERYGVGNRMICTQNQNSIPGVVDGAMNLIYNACDVGLNTSYFEGWGLPSYEHAATRKTQIVPRITASAEIWDECAVFLEPVTSFVQERTLCEGQLVSPEGVAEALEALYGDKEYRQRVAEACYQRVARPELSWENIGQRWHLLFQEVMESR